MTRTPTTDEELTDQELRAAADAERDADIDANREQLLAKLGATQTALAQARWHLAELCGNELYDIDFAEDPDGRDIDELLYDARRLIQGAAGIALRVIGS
jgi:hypothetical protein